MDKITELKAAVRRCNVIMAVGLISIFLGMCIFVGAFANPDITATGVLIAIIAVFGGMFVGFLALASAIAIEKELLIERAKQDPRCAHVLVSEGLFGKKVTRIYPGQKVSIQE